MEQTTSSEWWFEVFFYSWQMFQVVVYFIALYRLVKSDEYDARSAAKVAVYVKLPQILPVVLLAVFSILCLIVPAVGIFISIALWTRLIFTFIATSIVVMVACIKMAKTRTFSSGIAVVFSILSFIPVLEYIVPLILLGVSKRNRKPPVSGMYGQNGSMKYETAPNMYGQNMLPQNGAAPNMYGQNMLPQNTGHVWTESADAVRSCTGHVWTECADAVWIRTEHVWTESADAVWIRTEHVWTESADAV